MVETNATLDTPKADVPGSEPESRVDKLTGTTAEQRQAYVANAKETLSEAVASAVGKVKANPKTAAAIAAGATAVAAGAAYGATKLAKSKSTGTRKPAAKRTTAPKK